MPSPTLTALPERPPALPELPGDLIIVCCMQSHGQRPPPAGRRSLRPQRTSDRFHGIASSGNDLEKGWVVSCPPALFGPPPAAITGWYSAPRRFHGNASSGFHSLFFGWYSAPRRGLDRLQRQSLGGIPPPGVRWTASSSGHVFFGPPPAAITGWYTAPRRVFLWVVISGLASLKQRPKDVDE